MASIPCLKSENRCTPCADGNPLANLTIEPSDLNIWLGVYFGRPRNVTTNLWTTDACVGFCESAISQTDADDCARRRAEDCVPTGDVTDDPPPPDPPVSPQLFCNQETSCQSGDNCYTLPACTVFAGSQAEADAIAQSLCNNRVLDSAQSSPCSVFPPEPPLVPPECPAESGFAAPDSLEITSETTWLAAKTINDPAWTIEGDYLRTDTFDLPPGRYILYNLDGYVRHVTTDPEIFCQDGIFIAYTGLIDAESQIAQPNACAPFCAQPVDEDAIRVTCNAAEQANFDEAITLNERFNGTGKCRFEIGNCEFFGCVFGLSTYTPSYPFVFNLRQLFGLIPQPRKVQITSYSAPSFADPAGAAGWNGVFNTRDAYTSAELKWEAPAAGLFAGATLQYTMAHPTSANGKGWQLNIFSAGMILMWRGFKAVGSTSIGRYYKDSTSTPIGPACLVCADASDDQWYP